MGHPPDDRVATRLRASPIPLSPPFAEQTIYSLNELGMRSPITAAPPYSEMKMARLSDVLGFQRCGALTRN